MPENKKTLPTSRKSFEYFNVKISNFFQTYLSLLGVECGTLPLQVAKTSPGQFPLSFWISKLDFYINPRQK
ncbi:hypothetical protein AMC91_11930 [Elizabethkingia miricola]|uniref:Uncharacterized protein n=1 Tax=Elizabethkingia miricola TaxID=172045 RepID=A0ABD4DG74_ELIMR|nr:hypothetical protein AMC91_11930 [Elizabethkingia miricola]KUY13889.1 hypothetical protein ATB95_19095 [Elizabethkingia miricola]